MYSPATWYFHAERYVEPLAQLSPDRKKCLSMLRMPLKYLATWILRVFHEVPFFTVTVMIDIFAVKVFNLRVNRPDGKINLTLSDEHLNVLIYYKIGFNKSFS